MVDSGKPCLKVAGNPAARRQALIRFAPGLSVSRQSLSVILNTGGRSTGSKYQDSPRVGQRRQWGLATVGCEGSDSPLPSCHRKERVPQPPVEQSGTPAREREEEA